jgi:hypothetical protein
LVHRVRRVAMRCIQRSLSERRAQSVVVRATLCTD